MHTKAELRATRERLGIPQSKLAEVAGVQIRAVKRWESPKNPQQAPADVWAYLGEQLRMQDQIVDYAVSVAEASPAEVIRLPHWANQEDYDNHHGGPDHGYWRTANANARAVAITLEALGYSVEWVNENPVPLEAWK